MSYIGQHLPPDAFHGFTTDTFTGDGSATTFTLSKAPFSEDSLIVVVDNVIQQPTTNFTVSGTTLTIVGTAIVSGIKGYAIHTGGALPIGEASGLASNILTQQTDIGANIADADLFLVDDGAGGTLRKTAASRLKTYIGSPGGATGLDVNDSVKIRLGTGNDTELYFDGSDTIFDHTPGSGGFYIRGDNVTIQDSQSTPNQFVRMDTGSGVTFNESSLDHDFRIESNNYARMFDLDGGLDRIGIGNNASAPSQTLDVRDAQNDAIFSLRNTLTSGNIYGQQIVFGYAPDDNSNHFFYCADTVANRMFVMSDGDLRNHDNSYGSTSDERIKQNIRDANSQWDDIKAVKVRNYKKKDDVRQYGDKAWEQIGVIAQELEAAGMDKLVKESDPTSADIISDASFGTLYEDGDTIPDNKKIGDVKEVKQKVKGIGYSVLYMKAIKALQEAMAKIETLETKVKALEDA
jgi:hypothetical protein